MKMSAHAFKLGLLAATMLSAPGVALAQTPPPPPAEEPAASESEPTEILVLGKNIPEPQRDTSEVVSVLTAEDLARTGDDNAAAALSRLSGLSVVSGKFIFVRGLGDRYSQALLNGSPLPSPEPLRRTVPLDLFPSNILGGAIVQKTFSPDFSADFGGGVINLQTTKAPEDPFLTIEFGTGANLVSTGKNGLVYQGSDRDWTTFGGAIRNVPEPLQAALDSGRFINSANFTPTELQTIGRSLANTPLNLIQEQVLVPDFKGEATAGKTFEFSDFDIGLVAAVGYDSQQRNENATRQEVLGNTLVTDFQTQTTIWDVTFNALGGISFIGDENTVSLTSLIVRSSRKEAQFSDGTAAGLPPGTNQHQEGTAWYERQLATVQLNGDHTLGAFNLKWRTSVAETTRDAPYERGITYDVTSAFPLIFSQRSGNSIFTRFSDLTDRLFSGGIDASYTLALSPYRDVVFSAGYAYSRSSRDYNQRQFTFLQTTTDPNLIPTSLLTNRPDFLLQPDAIRPDGFQFTEFSGTDDSYKASLIVNGAYFAADAEILPLVHIAAGVRYEDGSERVRTLNQFGVAPRTAPVAINNDYWLPGITATWNFAENMQIRAAYSKTIGRPQFRELAFTPYIDPDTDRVYQGNPTLTDSRFNNYDVRYEFYFGTNQFVTLGGFYKTISNPIEEVVIQANEGGTRTTFINAPSAKLAGGEAEYRTRFTMPFEVPVLQDPEWLFSVNYTYTFSEVNGTTELIADPTRLPANVLVPASDFDLDGSPLQGTPKHILNSQFGYETDLSQTTIALGWVGERILRRGLGGVPIVFDSPGIELDVVHKQFVEIAGHKVTIGLSARNLLGEEHEEYQFSTLGRTEANTFERGRSISASVTANF